MPKRGPPAATTALAQSLRTETSIAQCFFGAVRGRINGVMPEPPRQLPLHAITDDPLMDDVVAKTR